MQHNTTKQVIVMRNDLKNDDGHKVRTGKLLAQSGHAPLKLFFDMGYFVMHQNGSSTFTCELNPDMTDWATGSFTKPCLQVNSEEELNEIYANALQAKLPTSMIEDSGLTEFGGKKTKTCIVIGPARNEQIDRITGHLKIF